MVNPSIALDIKRQKLAQEYRKANPDKHIIARLKESIRRHEKDMKKYNSWKRRYKKRTQRR